MQVLLVAEQILYLTHKAIFQLPPLGLVFSFGMSVADMHSSI